MTKKRKKEEGAQINMLQRNKLLILMQWVILRGRVGWVRKIILGETDGKIF